MQITTTTNENIKTTYVSNIYNYYTSIQKENRSIDQVVQFLLKVGYDEDYIETINEKDLEKYTNLESMVITEMVTEESLTDKVDEETCQRNKLYS